MNPSLETLAAVEGKVQARGAIIRPSSWRWLLVALLLVGLGGSLVADAWLTVVAMVVVVIGVPAAWLVWRYPEFGIVLLVFLGTQILHPELLDLRLPFGGGLELPDLLLVGLAGMLVVKQLFGGKASPLPTTHLLAPFLAFSAMALFSTLRAILLFGVEVSWSFSELRGVVYYLTLLLAAWQLSRREQVYRLFIGLFLIALATLGVMIAQQFFGSTLLVAGQEAGRWQIINIGAGDITRIRPPGHLLLYYLSIVAFALMAFSSGTSRRMGMFGLALLLNLVMLLTFTRAQWLASALAIFVSFVYVPRGMKVLLASVAVAIVFLGGLVLSTDKSSVLQLTKVNAFMAPLALRVESMVSYDRTLDSASLQTRQFQTRAAADAISRNPMLGVGMGNSYRRLTSQEAQNRNIRFTRFMENSYLYIATKMGLPALAVFGWLAAAIVVGSYQGLKRARDPFTKAIALATFASLIGLLFWGLTHPVLVLPEHTLVVGLIGGVGEALRRMNA